MLLAAVCHEARMAKPADGKSGASVRDHITAAVRMGRLKPDALDGPDVPDALAYLGAWYAELAQGRSYSGMTGTPDPLTYRDIDAWARLTGRMVRTEEVRALMLLDAASRHPEAFDEVADG